MEEADKSIKEYILAQLSQASRKISRKTIANLLKT